MTKIVDLPGTPAPLGMTGEADWETLLDYTGEVTEEVVRSWWGDLPQLVLYGAYLRGRRWRGTSKRLRQKTRNSRR